MKILIAGLGSIGQRHLRNLLRLGEEDILLYRTHTSHLADDDFKRFPVETDLTAALAHKPDAVLIANPTALHMQVALPAARAGCALFIEKPLTNHVEDLRELQEVLAGQHNPVLVAYQFRFNPGLRKLKTLIDSGELGKPLSFNSNWGEYLPDFHPGEDYRQGYAARKELGGGVVLTLSHPLDYLRWLFGDLSGLCAFTANASELQLDVEDCADVLLRFRSGLTGSLHLDFFRKPKRHDLEVVCAQGVIQWDFADSTVKVRRHSGEEDTYRPPHGFERNSMYLEEMRHFLIVVRREEEPVCTFEDGMQAMLTARAILQSSRYGQYVVFDQFEKGR